MAIPYSHILWHYHIHTYYIHTWYDDTIFTHIIVTHIMTIAYVFVLCELLSSRDLGLILCWILGNTVFTYITDSVKFAEDHCVHKEVDQRFTP